MSNNYNIVNNSNNFNLGNQTQPPIYNQFVNPSLLTHNLNQTSLGNLMGLRKKIHNPNEMHEIS